MTLDTPQTSEAVANLLHRFADVTCTEGRVYGVETSCDTCVDRLNPCFLQALYQNLVYTMEFTVQSLGYYPYSVYHQETFILDPNTRIYQTRWPGVASINKKLSYTPLHPSLPINYYLQTNIQPQDSGYGFCVVQLDRSRIQNPERVAFWDLNGISIPAQAVSGYPKKSGDHWIVALGSVNPPGCGTALSVMDCETAYVDIPPSSCSYPVLVYQHTGVPIPELRRETLSSGHVRVWLPIRALKDENFDRAYVQPSELYKFMTHAASKCRVEESAPAKCVYKDGTETIVNIQLIDSVNGLVEFLDFGKIEWNKAPVKLVVHYKTDPAVLGYGNDILDSVYRAAFYLTASTLPIKTCQCEVKNGFIAEAQRAYTEIRVNPVTGETVHNLRHGNLYGQLMYAEMLSRVPRYQKLVRL